MTRKINRLAFYKPAASLRQLKVCDKSAAGRFVLINFRLYCIKTTLNYVSTEKTGHWYNKNGLLQSFLKPIGANYFDTG